MNLDDYLGHARRDGEDKTTPSAALSISKSESIQSFTFVYGTTYRGRLVVFPDGTATFEGQVGATVSSDSRPFEADGTRRRTKTLLEWAAEKARALADKAGVASKLDKAFDD